MNRDPQELRQRRDAIHEELATIGDLRPGSLVGRYRRCGKPTCHCAGEGDPGHGPSWSLTRTIRGRTVTRVIPAEAVEATRAQIAEHRRLRRLTGELVEVSEGLCDALLVEPVDGEGVGRGGSATPSRRRSRPRSRPS
jgi:hypothetical protein